MTCQLCGGPHGREDPCDPQPAPFYVLVYDFTGLHGGRVHVLVVPCREPSEAVTVMGYLKDQGEFGYAFTDHLPPVTGGTLFRGIYRWAPDVWEAAHEGRRG